MKVTLTCEKCGATVYVCEHLETGAELDQVLDIMDTNDVGLPSCPNCTKLTYGPLTEEMVADALIECSRSHNEVEDDYYECEARFVLRLIKDITPEDPRLWWHQTDEELRNWLLDLARQK